MSGDAGLEGVPFFKRSFVQHAVAPTEKRVPLALELKLLASHFCQVSTKLSSL